MPENSPLAVGQALIITRDVVNALLSAGVLTEEGTFNGDLAQEVAAIAAVEKVLVKHGVDIPAKADEIIQALPGILGLFGITS
jgi:hypothetical protein